MNNTLAERIDRLFRNFTKPDGSTFTYQDVEEGSGGEITAAYVWKLHKGQGKNPGARKLQALADFFGVPVSYFYGREELSEEYLESLKLARQLRETGVDRIALRASDLNERGKEAVLSMIEYIRKAQGLPSALNAEEQEQGQDTLSRRPDAETSG